MPKHKFFSDAAAFSLLEVLIVTVIISILAGIAIPLYNKSKEHGLGNEAEVNLKLIYAAEQTYRMEHGSYTVCSCSSDAVCNGASGCNTLLKLNLNTLNWAYSVSAGGWGVGWRSYATRQGAGGYLDCAYRVLLSNSLSSSNPDVSSGAGTCP